MFNQTEYLTEVNPRLFDRVMRLVEEIGDKEEHFNNLQTSYRKLASTWLLGSFAACGYVLKSADELPFSEWYFVFGICMGATAGLCILWMMDLKVYQKLLGSFFFQGILLELQYYQWLTPFRINIVLGQKTGEIISKVQYYYFFSVVILQALAIIAVWHFEIFRSGIAGKIICTIVIAGAVFTAQIIFLRQRKKTVKNFNHTDLGQMIKEWKLKTGYKPNHTGNI